MVFMRKKLLACAAVLSAFAVAAAGCSSEIDQTADVTTPATEATQDAAVPSTEAPTEATTEEPTEPPLLEKAEELLAQNPDTIGYISIEGTDVDNPVVQTVDNDYYLHIAFDGTDHRAGTVYMDFRDVFSWQEDMHSENIVLYGHNMADNSMFGSLRRYRQDLEFYKEAPIIKFSSNYKEYSYVIFGLVITAGSAAPPNDDLYADPMTWEGFPYWNMEELDTEKHFNYYVDTIESMNMIENNVDVEVGDDLLTLSTCYSDEDNSRFLVVARRLREDETEESIKEIVNAEPVTQEATTTAAAE
jgi:sortase B